MMKSEPSPAHTSKRASQNQTVALVAGAIVALSVVWLLVGPGLHTDPSRLYLEAERYLLMAGWQPGVELAEVNYPSKYRILTPLIVRSLPVDAAIGFQIFTALCLIVFFFLLWRVFIELGFSQRWSACGVVIGASLFYPTVYYVHNPFMTDPLFFCLMTAGIIAILRKRYLLLALILAIGVLNKETIVFLFPAYLFLSFDRRAVVKSLGAVVLVFAPAIVVYLSLRSIYGYAGGDTSITPSFVVNWALDTIQAPRYLSSLASGLLLSGAPLWVYALMGWRSSSSLMKRYLIGGALSVAPLLLLASDSGRELAKLAPFWIAFVLHTWSMRIQGQSAFWIAAPVVTGNIILSIVTLHDLGRTTEMSLRVIAVMLMMLPAAMIALNARRKAAQEAEGVAS